MIVARHGTRHVLRASADHAGFPDTDANGPHAPLPSPPLPAPSWQPSARYADQPIGWPARLFGMGGVTMIMLVIAGGAFFTWRTYTAPPVGPALTTFDLAAPTAPPEPPSETPPAPEQKETPPPVPDRPSIEPPKVELPAVNPVPFLAAQPFPDPGPPIERKTAPQQESAPSAPQASSGKPTWEGMILAALNKARRYPRQAQQARQQGVPYIRFVMDREGRVLSVQLERSCGIRLLDEEAITLPKRAAPLPKPPKDVGGSTIELVVPVEFFLR